MSPGLELLDVVLVTTGPVGGHAHVLLAQDGEDFFDFLVVDDLPDAHVGRGVDRYLKGQVAVRQAEDEVLALLAEIGPQLSPLDDRGPVMGVDDFVPDVKRHSSPKDPRLVWPTPRVGLFGGWIQLTAAQSGCSGQNRQRLSFGFHGRCVTPFGL